MIAIHKCYTATHSESTSAAGHLAALSGASQAIIQASAVMHLEKFLVVRYNILFSSEKIFLDLLSAFKIISRFFGSRLCSGAL